MQGTDALPVRAVLQETLRLFPPVPVNLRAPIKGAVVFPAHDDTPRQYIPSDASIMYCPLLVQRSKDLWGPDADEFDPERWMDPERIKKVVANPFMFIPFHAGPRIVRHSLRQGKSHISYVTVVPRTEFRPERSKLLLDPIPTTIPRFRAG